MPVMMRARGQGLALCRSVLLVLAAISFVHVADARLRLWFRTYDEHGNLSVEDYTLEAEEGGGAIPTRTVRLDHMATGIEYWMEGGGQITLRRIEANGADRDVARYDRAVGIETVGNLRFNVIDYGAAAEQTNPPPYDSVGRPPDYQEEDPFYDPGLKEFAQAGFRFLEMSGSSYQKRQEDLYGNCYPKDSGSYVRSCSTGYWVQSIKNPDEPCWLCSACPIKGLTCTKAPKTCTDISYGKDGQIGCNGPPPGQPSFVCPGLENPAGCSTYVSCQNGKVTKTCGSSVPDCDAGANQCLESCTSCK